MNKIVFFDIDGTLFDTASFLVDLRSKISSEFQDPQILETDFTNISDQVKKEQGYFIPSHFLDKISILSKNIDRAKLESIFWDNEFVSEHLFTDSSVVSQIAKIADIGIFSKGEEAWQKQKIHNLLSNIKSENIYIFPDKLTHIKLVFDKYPTSSIFLIENDINVIKTVKKLFPGINCILIDREGNLEDNVEARKIESLKDLINIV